MSAWGQTSPGASGHAGEADDISVAATSSPHKIAELKKAAAKESRKNAAAAARAAKAAPTAPK
ncbi:MAG TPA: hypothetical protein VHW25_11715 [Steroidobacteraceae bacterium]|jgi:hypothetical protein|nr:hypothetical protein [Steroidobacteraceae bacterium]